MPLSARGAAALACLDLLVAAGAEKENIIVTDRFGVLYNGRKHGMDRFKARYAAATKTRSLGDAVRGADLFLGLSAGGVLTPEMVRTMNRRPIIFALANPDPEIWPEDAKRAAPDAIIATGRSDYPNQVNNVPLFSFSFSGSA